MKMTGHTICLEGQRSHSLCMPVRERVIARELVEDGEKWSLIHAACSHLLSANISSIGLSVVLSFVWFMSHSYIYTKQIPI